MPAIPCGGCGKFTKGDLYTTDQCRFCWLRYHHKEYRDYWSDEAPKKPEARKGGPGTELKKLLSEMALVGSIGCSCDAFARLMDSWGVEGCREHMEEIIGKLKTEAKTRGWMEILNAAAKAVQSGFAFQINPLRPYHSLVEEAIRRAEKHDIERNNGGVASRERSGTREEHPRQQGPA